MTREAVLRNSVALSVACLLLAGCFAWEHDVARGGIVDPVIGAEVGEFAGPEPALDHA